MSEHKITLKWDRESEDFAYKTYNREHSVSFKNGKTIELSAAAEFLGKPSFIDPEEMFVAAYASCHMLTFLAIAAKSRIIVDSYEDSAVGYLEKNAQGKLAITRIELFPKISFEGETPSAEKLAELHRLSHDECFIANSSTVAGSVHPQS
jgi:organic hydroperoxide reductase OsmC/OhrA